MDEEYNSIIKEFLDGPHAEALEWLQGSAANKRRLVEHRSTAQSVALVEKLYALGAEKVIAVALTEWKDGQGVTRYLLIELSDDPHRRASLFGFEREEAEARGFEGQPDEGQLYLFLDVKGIE